MSRFKRLSPGTILGALALFVSLGGVGYAATGGNFILGQANSATSQTALTAGIANKALQVTNSSSASGAAGIGITVAANHAPLSVPANAGKATNLNADKLDGKDSTAFLTPSQGVGTNGPQVISNCSSNPILSYPLTVTRPAHIFASAAVESTQGSGAAGPWSASAKLLLRNASNSVVAVTGQVAFPPITTSPSAGGTWAGVLIDVNTAGPYTATPGTYTLELEAGVSTCAGSVSFKAPFLTSFLLSG